MTDIRKLDMRSVPDVGVCIFDGRSNSGKTLLIREVMRQKSRHFKKALIMTGSATTAREMASHVPDCFIYDGFHETVLEKAVDKQDVDAMQGKCTPLLVVLDDLAYLADKIKSCEVIKKIFFNGRHYRILLLLSMQYCKLFPPAFRSNVNYVFLTNEKNPMNRTLVHDAFNNIFASRDSFDRAMVSITQGYRAMVLDNWSNSSMSISDNVFWYKAPFPAIKWQMNPGGSIWRYHSRHYDSKYYLKPKTPETGKKRGRGRPASDAYKVVR
jgi:hypothetical protein